MKALLFVFSFLLWVYILPGQQSVMTYSNFDVFENEILKRGGDSVYVINFWATWCRPCVKELPYFDRLNEEYLPKKVKVILVSLDDKRYLSERLEPFIKNRAIQSEVVLLGVPDANAWIDRVDPEWSGSIPATIIYSKRKRVFKEEEFEQYSDIESIVKSFF
jgi:thiol-disulfide isomerase/thioredoxin